MKDTDYTSPLGIYISTNCFGVVPVLGETADDIAFTHYGTEKYYFSIASKKFSVLVLHTRSLFKLNAHDAIHVRRRRLSMA